MTSVRRQRNGTNMCIRRYTAKKMKKGGELKSTLLLLQRRIERLGHELVAQPVGMRVTRHRPKLARREVAHRGQEVHVGESLLARHAGHVLVDEAELVIDQVVDVRRHGEIDADAAPLRDR